MKGEESCWRGAVKEKKPGMKGVVGKKREEKSEDVAL